MSQSSYFLNNGSSLEDCYTNFFALADLCGIKWRQFSSNKHSNDINDDQILSSYAKCIAADHLAVWRRVKIDNSQDHSSTTSNAQTNSYVQYKKELWIFWYGEDPSFNELVSSNLISGENGTWEVGLNYECRTLLFKALHNLIEKSLLSKGYIRLGQWFFQIKSEPSWSEQFVKSDKLNDGTQVTFKFNFFLHGDSNVCANIDVRQHSSICQLSKDDIYAAQNIPDGIKVILGPHGLQAQLTGQTFKGSDPRVQKLLSDWKKFYPMPTNTTTTASSVNNELKTRADNEFLSKVIEVVIEDCKLHYPAIYVFISEADRNAYSLVLKKQADSQSHLSTTTTTTPSSSTSSPVRALTMIDAISQMNRKSDEYLEDGTLSLQPNSQTISSDIFCLKAMAHQANNLCDSLSIMKTHICKDLCTQEMLQNLNTHLRIKVDCSCLKCQNSGGKKSSKTNLFHSFLGNSHKGKEKNIEREKARFLKNSASFHQRSALSSKQNSETTLANHQSEKTQQKFTSNNNNAIPRSPGSNAPNSANPSSVPGPNSVSQMPIISYKSPVSVSNSSILNTPGVEASPLENGELQNSEQINSVNTPNSVPSNQVPQAITIKEEPVSSIQHVESKTVNNSQQDVNRIVFEMKDCQDKILTKQEFYLKQSFDGECDLRVSALYSFDYENDADSWGLPTKRFRRKRDCGLFNDHWSTFIKNEIDIDEKNINLNDLNRQDNHINSHTTQNGNVNSELNKILAQRPNTDSMDTTKKLLGGKRLREETSMDDEIFSRSFHSPEEDPNDAFQPPHTPKFTSLSRDDHDQNSMFNHQLGPAELSIMYPTPPSLEAMVQSPCSTFISVQENAVIKTEPEALIEKKEKCSLLASHLSDEIKDEFLVYKPPVQTCYTSSEKYAPLKDLVTPTIPESFIYKASIKKEKVKNGINQSSSSSSSASSNSSTISSFHQVFNSPSINNMRPKNVYNHLSSNKMPGLPGPIIRGPRGQASINEGFSPMMSLNPRMTRAPIQSPMYNGIGFANSPSLTVDPSMSPITHNNFLASPVPRSPFTFQGNQNSMNSPGASFGPMASNYPGIYPQSSIQRSITGGMMYGNNMSLDKTSSFDSNSLLLNVLLSDSMFNLFRDHNFESCSICVCNMNIKGNDVGIYLPEPINTTVSNGNEFETEYRCTCGFSALVNRHLSQFSGMFYEDEVDITGKFYDPTECEKPSFDDCDMFDETLRNALSVNCDESIVDFLLSISTTIFPTTSSFYKIIHSNFPKQSKPFNLSKLNSFKLYERDSQRLAYEDCNNVISLALMSIKDHNAKTNLLLVSSHRGNQPKKTLLHDWPFRWSKLPVNNHEVIYTLKSIQPLIGEAISRKSSGIDAVTYNTVKGPLTWRQFHRMASRGTECQGEPQPIPQLMVGYDKENAVVSPFALKFWEKSAFEPYSVHRDVAYIALIPNNIYLISEAKKFFKQLSSTYEILRFGQHIPLKKVVKNGLVVLDPETIKKNAENSNNCDEWIEQIGDSPLAKQIKIYAQTLNSFVQIISTYDAKLFKPLSKNHHSSSSNSITTNHSSSEQNSGQTNTSSSSSSATTTTNTSSSSSVLPSNFQSNHMNSQFMNSNFSSNNNQRSIGNNFGNQIDHFGQQNQQSQQQDKQQSEHEQHHHNNNNDNSICTLNQALQVFQDEEDFQRLPSIVLYIIDPFTVHGNHISRFGVLGLIKAFTKMKQQLPEHIQNLVHLQLLSPDALACNESKKILRPSEFRDICFSTFSLCKQQFLLQSNVKSLTGLGPASAFKDFLKKEDGVVRKMQILTNPYVLAPQLKGKNTDLNEIADSKDKNQVLYCAYCLSEDQKWLFVSCTNDKCDILQTKMINIHVPNRLRRRNATVRRYGLNKMMHFLKTVMAENVCGWRLVIGRLGRMGHGELKDWTFLLSKKSLLKYSRQLRELCGQCHTLGINEQPGINSACLISFEADTALRVFPNYFTPDERFSSTCNTCSLSTPEDASCTHILVFPTSATAQFSHGNFSMDNTGDGDLFNNLADNPEDEEWNGFDLFGLGGLDGVDGDQNNSPGGAQQNFGAPEMKDSNNMDEPEESTQLSQQPLALAFYVSTAPTGPLPSWFWSKGSHLEKTCPTFLKSALLIHTPFVQQNSDDLLSQSSDRQGGHSLDSSLTTDVLRFVLEGYNSLSWLALDPSTFDRISCLPIHIQVLMQLYHSVHALT